MDIFGLMGKKDEKAVKYMQKKYGDKLGDVFAVVDAEYAGFTSGADTFYMSSKLFPSERVVVQYFEKEYDDDYMDIYFNQQYQEYMESVLKDILGECKVFKRRSVSSHYFSENTTFEEYMKGKKSLKRIVVIVRDDSDMKEKLEKVAVRLKELQLPHGGLRVEVAKDYEAIKQLKDYSELCKYERSQKERIYQERYYRLDMDREFNIEEICERNYLKV